MDDTAGLAAVARAVVGEQRADLGDTAAAARYTRSRRSAVVVWVGEGAAAEVQ